MNQPPLVLITGISRGLGRAMAIGFAARGYRVAGCARTAEALAELTPLLGPDALLRAVDLTDEGAVSRFAIDVTAAAGTPDFLINSAAQINRPAPLWEIPAEDMASIFEVNVLGLTHVIRHFVPGMIARRSGIIVNFSSGWGRSTSSGVAPYCATKWAVEGLTAALAQDLPRGLAAVAFNPGVIDTDMLRTCFGEEAAHYPDPDTWATTAVPFLAALTSADNGRPLTSPGH
jgi:NAD(P)-dependent dehydrogenase (short-subunit alcohol dehydrogenase family)